ncbi:hypothetical protein [Methanobrevibacter sp.]
MRKNLIIMLLAVFIISCSVTAIAAESSTIGDHTLDVPEGYKISETTDTQGTYIKDNDHVIIVMFTDTVTSNEDSQAAMEAKGYTCLGNKSYEAEGYSVNQQNFEKDNITVFTYDFEMKDGKYCVITYTIPSDEEVGENDANPITGILQTLK